jgi:hypothetical protein
VAQLFAALRFPPRDPSRRERRRCRRGYSGGRGGERARRDGTGPWRGPCGRGIRPRDARRGTSVRGIRPRDAGRGTSVRGIRPRDAGRDPPDRRSTTRGARRGTSCRRSRTRDAGRGPFGLGIPIRDGVWRCPSAGGRRERVRDGAPRGHSGNRTTIARPGCVCRASLCHSRASTSITSVLMIS